MANLLYCKLQIHVFTEFTPGFITKHNECGFHFAIMYTTQVPVHKVLSFSTSLLTTWEVTSDLSLEDFVATEFNKIFFGRRPRQGIRVLQ